MRYLPKFRPHPIQLQLWNSKARFRVVPAGRRSGKTAIAKRFLIRRAVNALDEIGHLNPPYNFFAAAPIRDQAKRIYWADLKNMIPSELMDGRPSESELTIKLINGASITVVGMDKPERIEGTPWDGGILDEYANMKAHAWGANVRPALSDRRGWCWLIGVPEGRNHYYETYMRALADESGEWQGFTWKSVDILPPEEVEAAKRDLDELTFQQEYEASFINFEGRAYYPFTFETHSTKLRHLYDPRQPLIFCFDFNVAPGVAAVCQELQLPSGQTGTAVIGEVYIPRNSNTPAVCRKLIADWGTHQGNVICYGDATGGSKGSAKVQGSDWDLIRAEFRAAPFASRISYRVPSANPAERSRVNAVNSRLKNQSGEIKLMVDAQHAPHVAKDLDGVALLKGGSGEIDKKGDPDLTHISDALGYYIVFEYSTTKRTFVAQQPTGGY